MDNYQKFKSLLEYFVSHMEWIVNKDVTHIGYDKYIKHISDFKQAGQGYNGDGIQRQISKWEKYGNDTLCINIYASCPKGKGTYINWKGTWENIKPIWKDDHISKLYLSTQDFAHAEPEFEMTIGQLGLFEDGNPNTALRKFFDKYLQIHMNISDLEKTCIELLKTNRNLILTGAPGTGKTFLAKKIAKRLGATISNGRCEMVQFHPSMDYSDFVEGLRPVKGANSNEIYFERRNGIFKDFCLKALKKSEDRANQVQGEETEANAPKDFIFIIDEINRGELSKILGELFFSIDPGYRGESGRIKTQYQNLIEPGDEFKNGFYVPDNVYIIGTMNDIDRSIESMDFAMRRRFAWQEITAESQMIMFDDDNAWPNKIKPDARVLDELKARMKNLNNAIIDNYSAKSQSGNNLIGLSTAYQIGPAYFLKYCQYNNFEDLWEFHIKGLLYEYLRGMTNIESKMKMLYEAYCDTSKS